MALRCVTKKKENRGKYMWMCHAGYVPGQKGCGLFTWAEFDEDGEPPWASKLRMLGKRGGWQTNPAQKSSDEYSDSSVSLVH
jgi:hypothetical protein